LYWWDYKTSYDAVFAEFVGNESRQRHIALCRGAAQAQAKDWGAIVTWKYNMEPYLEDGEELLKDLKLAYAAGAKYMIVFDYPKIGPYGTLNEGHFDALKEFWEYAHGNPQDFGSQETEVAYVLPRDYGFGFRNPRDTIWGLWNFDELSQKVWGDVNKMLNQYGSRFDIVYDDSETIAGVQSRYRKLYFWNETIPVG
jgi:hypothetical protein